MLASSEDIDGIVVLLRRVTLCRGTKTEPPFLNLHRIHFNISIRNFSIGDACVAPTPLHVPNPIMV